LKNLRVLLLVFIVIMSTMESYHHGVERWSNAERNLRPILRRFDSEDSKPASVGKPTPPPTSQKFIVPAAEDRPVLLDHCQRRDMFCIFCKKNGLARKFYASHSVRDNRGKVVCPVLRKYNCPFCNNGGGDKAHTVTYCPVKRAAYLDSFLKK